VVASTNPSASVVSADRGRPGSRTCSRRAGSSLTYIGEAWLIEKLDDLVRWHHVLHDDWGDFTTWRRTGVTRDRFLAALSRFYAELLQTASRGHRFIEKTPEWNVFFLPLLRELFPRARFIFPYRDGRNYVASAEAMYQRLGKAFDFGKECRRWASAMRVIDDVRKRGVPPTAMLVRYEDLVERFAEVLPDLCEFARIQPFAARPFPPNSAFANHRGGQDFNTRWHGWSDERKDVFRQHAGAELVRWGYATSPDGW
jgi:hypothetical protein